MAAADKKSRKGSVRKGGKKHSSHMGRPELSHFLGSFREMKTPKALVVAGFDVMFYVIALTLTYITSFVLKIIAEPLNDINPAMASLQSQAQLSQMQGVMTKVLILSLVILAVYLLLVFLSFVLSRQLIWTTLLGKKLKHRAFWKFALLHAIWFAAVLIAMLILSLPARLLQASQEVMAYSVVYILLFIAVFYFTYMMYYIFTEKEIVLRTIRDMFRLGAKSFSRLWLPFLLSIGVFVAASVISLLSNLLPEMIARVFTGLLLLAVVTWIKVYLSSALKRNLGL